MLVLIGVFWICVLASVAAYDVWKNPKDPKRAKEYAFLAYTAFAAIAYGVAHDHVTATISREYFLQWKGLAYKPGPFRWSVTVLAVRASFGTGLIAGAALLLANNVRTGKPLPLAYRQLVMVSLIPLASAAVCATLFGIVNAEARFGLPTALALPVPPERAGAFVTVWAIHFGSYAGALVGTIASIATVVVRRRRSRNESSW